MLTILGGMTRLSQPLTAIVLENLFGLKLTTGMIAKPRNPRRTALEPVHHQTAATARSSETLHADETRWLEACVKAWSWTDVSPLAALCPTRDSRHPRSPYRDSRLRSRTDNGSANETDTGKLGDSAKLENG